eukprot:14516463-Ditylum_brightwellii.AAC.1
MAYLHQIRENGKLEPLPYLDDLALMGKRGGWKLCHSLLPIINLSPSFTLYTDHEKKEWDVKEKQRFLLFTKKEK